MEKRFRDFLRHLDKLDWDVLSDEEIRDEREGIQLHRNVMHQEMMKHIIILASLLISASVLLGASFISQSQLCLVFAILSGASAGYLAKGYFKNRDTMNRLYVFADKITQIY